MNTAVSAGRASGHDHVVGFYRGDADLVAAIASFLTESLEEWGAAVIVADAEHREAIDRALGARGVPIEALRSCGRYRALDARETLATFMRDDQPDAGGFEAHVGKFLRDAASHGPVRVFGEMVALLWDDGNVAAALGLELLWNELAAEHAFTLYCAYPMTIFQDPDHLAATKSVCDLHSTILSFSNGIGAVSSPLTDSDTLTRTFVPTAASLRPVRLFVSGALDAWGIHLRSDNALIIASELAANALMHASSPFRLSISQTPSSVRIEVRDASTTPPQHLRLETDALHGRGIALIAALSDAWGTRQETDGKTVWAEIALP